MKMQKTWNIVIIISVFFLLTGCGGKISSTDYVREDIDYSYIQRIGVLPFTNKTEDKLAGERARDITITQVLALGLFDTVDKGIVDAVMEDEALNPGAAIDPLSLKRIGQRIRAQAFILGTIDLAQENRIGSVAFPQIAITLRLVDTESGMVLWQASGTSSGESWGGRLFGVTPDDPFKTTDKLIRHMLRNAP
jgi:hypothetical protein